MSDKDTKTKSSEKKPFYKQWWFWVIVVLVLVIGVGGSSTETNTENSSNSGSPSVSSECSDDEKVEIVDLSSMKANDIAKWTKDNGLDYKVGDADYSETVARESMLSQSINLSLIHI